LLVWWAAFRFHQHTWQCGHPHLLPWPGVVIGQVVKRYHPHRVMGIKRRLV
jgi:hypothetical protein